MERQFLKLMKKSARIRQEWRKREIRRSLYRLHRILHTPTVLSHLWLKREDFLYDYAVTAPTLRSGLYVLIWLLSVAYQLLVKFILSDTSKTSSPVGIVTFPFVTVSLSLSYDFVYPSMNTSGSVTVSPLFV